MDLWLYVAVCGLACLTILIILGVMRFKDIIRSDFWPEFIFKAMIVAFLIFCAFVVYDSYKVMTWMQTIV